MPHGLIRFSEKISKGTTGRRSLYSLRGPSKGLRHGLLIEAWDEKEDPPAQEDQIDEALREEESGSFS